MRAIDRLMQAVAQKQNPTVFGLDTRYEYLPEASKLGESWLEEGMERMWAFNKALMDALHDIVPAVKIQIAYYEMYGIEGMKLFQKTADYARKMGFFVIIDAKRGDIGPTAGAYAAAFLGETEMDEHRLSAFLGDMLTINPYLGSDGVLPFVQEAEKHQKGVFVLVKTSNPSSGEFQDLVVDDKPIYRHVAQKVSQWGETLLGEGGYSDVGAVVGATYPEQGVELRKAFPHVYFLVPGYGAQGAAAQDLSGCFDSNGHGAIVNASRSLLCAYKKHPGKNAADASREEAIRMKEDLLSAIGGSIRKG